MKLRRIISLCCLQALFITDGVVADGPETLIVGPLETLDLRTPEAAHLEAALGGGPLKPLGTCTPATECRAALTAPAGGDHWLALASRDRAGNRSPIRWIRLRVDGEPPSVELEPASKPVVRDRPWMAPRARITATAEDDLADVARLFLAIGEDVQEVSEREVSVQLPASGDASVRAWAIDHVGNRSAETRLDLAIDSTPPSGEIRPACASTSFVVSQGVVVVAPDCPIAASVLDGESGVAEWKPRIDGEAVGVEALKGPWAEGSHTIEVTALDAVGNTSGMALTLTADATGPEISWAISSDGVEGASGESFYRPPVTVTAAAVDSPAGLARLSASVEGAFQAVSGPIEVHGDRLRLRAVDQVGNVSETEAVWRLDQEPPEIQLETQDGSVAPPGTLQIQRGDVVRLRASDPGAGLDAATYSLFVKSADILRRWWWSPPHRQPLPEELAFPWPGDISLEIEAIDRLGNRATARWDIRVLADRSGKEGQ